MKRHLTASAVLLALAAALLPAAALALTYSPPSFDYTANPGDTVSDTLSIQNETPDPLTIKAQAVNFTGKPGDETSGVPVFYPADQAGDGRGLAPWISIVNPSVTLKPGEHGSFFFSIKVPKGADPGSHFGAIVMTTVTPGAQPGVGVIGNSAALILMKVNGNVTEDLKLSSFTAEPKLAGSLPVRFEARLQNDGNVHERPYGQVTVKDLFGRTVAVIPMNRADNKSVLPGAARRFDSEWNGRALPAGASTLARQWNNFAIGPYTAEVSLQYGVQNRVLVASAVVWVFPWLALSIGLAGAVILCLLLRAFFRWYRKKVISQYEQQEK